jgi:hypothetical protein
MAVVREIAEIVEADVNESGFAGAGSQCSAIPSRTGILACPGFSGRAEAKGRQEWPVLPVPTLK